MQIVLPKLPAIVGTAKTAVVSYLRNRWKERGTWGAIGAGVGYLLASQLSPHFPHWFVIALQTIATISGVLVTVLPTP